MAKVNTSLTSKKSAPNVALIKQAILARQANKRQGTSHVKTRSEVSGGGRKPWRQKGTGRARAGSSRSPIWVGGGITFGPDKARNHKHALPKKMGRKALLEMLAYLQAEKRLEIVKSLSLKNAKTKEALKMLGDRGLTGKKATLVTEKIEPELVLATRNLEGVNTVVAVDLSILNIASGYVVIEEKAAERFGLKTSTPKPATKKTSNTKKETK